MGIHPICVVVKTSRQNNYFISFTCLFFSFYEIMYTFLIYGIMHSQFVIDVLSHRLMIEN